MMCTLYNVDKSVTVRFVPYTNKGVIIPAGSVICVTDLYVKYYRAILSSAGFVYIHIDIFAESCTPCETF